MGYILYYIDNRGGYIMRDYNKLKAAMRKYANGMRLKAILALGGRCQGTGYCPQDDAREMYVIMIDKGLAKMDKVRAYRKIVESLEPKELAIVLCKQCRESMRSEAKLVKVNKGKRKAKVIETEMVYIAGERVTRPKGYDDTPDHLIDNIND